MKFAVRHIKWKFILIYISVNYKDLCFIKINKYINNFLYNSLASSFCIFCPYD